MKKFFNIFLIGLMGLFLFACEMPQSQSFTEEDLEATFAKLFVDVDVDHVTEDLHFPSRLDGARITYVSSMQSVISNTGKVTRTDTDEEVEVTVTIKHATLSYEDVVVFTVLKAEYNQDDPHNPVDPTVDPLDLLSDALASFDLSNLTIVEESYVNTEFGYKSEYQIAGNMMHFLDTYYYEDELNTDEYYFVFEDGEMTLALYNIEDEFYDMTEYADLLLYYSDYYFDYYNFEMSADDFEYQDGVYYVKADALARFGAEHIGISDDSTTDMVSLTLKDGKLYQLIANSTYEEEGEEYKSVYVIEFSNYGEVELTLPAVSELGGSSISDIYDMEKGDEVEVQGIVMGFLGQNVYIEDSSAAIVVYFKNNSLPANIEVGNLLTAKGTVDIFNNLYEVVVTSADDVEVEEYYEAEELQYYQTGDLSYVNSEFMSAVFDLIDVKSSTLTASADQDTSIIITDTAGNEFTLFVKKANASLFNEIFKDFDETQSLTIYSVALTCYKENLQFVLTAQTEAEEYEEEIIDPEDPLAELAKAFANMNTDNYRFDETYYVNEELYYHGMYLIDGLTQKFVDTYEYDGEMTSDYYYFVFDNEGEYTLILLSYDNEDEFYDITDDYEDYLDYADYYYPYYDFTFNVSDFEYVDGRYLVKEESLIDIAYDHFAFSESFEILEIEFVVENGYLAKVMIKCTREYEEETYDIYSEFVFSEFGSVELTLPDASDDDYSISNVYNMAKGDEVVVYGWVMGFNGQNVYIEDDTAAIVVYFKNASYIPDGLKVGDILCASGKVDIFNGLYEVVVASADDAMSEEGFESESAVYCVTNELAQIDESYMSYIFNLRSVKLSTLTVSADQDTSITLTDRYGTEMTLFVKKAQAALFNSIFAGANANEFMNIDHLALSCYKTNLQFVLTEQTKFDVLEGFDVETDTYYVPKGTELALVLANIELGFFEDNQYISLNPSELQYETEYDKDTAGTYTITFTYGEEAVQITVIVIEGFVEENVQYDILEKVAYENTTYKPGLPSTGDVNILVIPIKFNNSPDYDLSIIETGFNSTNGETGWYSLKEFYQVSSYGNLNFTAHITEPYETNENYSFKTHKTGVDDYRYFLNAITYFDNDIDYTMYDQNSDGYIDCVYLIYLAPIDYSGQSPYDMYWAYCYEYFEEENEAGEYAEFDGLGLDYYLWASIEFFNEPFCASYDNIGNVSEEDSIYVNINCETIIHETGHALGLDDYYDYDTSKGTTGGVGAAFMMDANQGDHDPFSKAILGWTNPTVLFQAEGTFNLASFASTGDTLIIKKTNSKSYFDEYYVVAFYTPTLINEAKHDLEAGVFGVDGILILHIDATLNSELPSDEYSPIDIYQFNNANTSHKLIKIVEADGNNDIDKSYYAIAEDSDLFQVNDTLTLTWYDGTTSNIKISVDAITEEYATVSVSLNN